MKKGQVTVFIVLGIIILILAGYYFFVMTPSEKITEVPDVLDQKTTTTFVSRCLENTLVDAVVMTSLHGGYVEPIPAPSAVLEGNYVRAYALGEYNTAPEKEDLEKEIATYIDLYLNSCLNDLNAFKEKGYTVNVEPSQTTVVVQDDFVSAKLNYPITLSKKEDSFTISQFDAVVKTRLGTIFNGVLEITNESDEGPCLSCLVDFGAENGMTFEFDTNENVYVVNIIDNQVLVNNQPFEFKFAYDFS